VHFFTSITCNYIPKARVLAHSVKQHVPGAVFHLLLCDRPPEDFDLDKEDFDHLILLDDLDIDNKAAWIFKRGVVELCTAVKGLGFQEIFRRFDPDKVIFFDPDIALFSNVDLIEQALNQHSILLTPHLTEPEQAYSAVLDNEVSCLKYGVFNLGFLAVRNTSQGMSFVNWWSERLRDFCFDDKQSGLFTDQKWVDLALAFFPDIGILREPQCNVSTWNLSHRRATGDITSGIQINQRPLCFYHFSGLDSGAQKVMLEVYGEHSPVLLQLRNWYLQQCKQMGQKQLGQAPCHYQFYDNGDEISPAERLLYRYREELAERFPDPYACPDSGDSYQNWYRRQGGAPQNVPPDSESLWVLQRELDSIHHSISWRITRKMAQLYRKSGLRLGLRRFIH
jgi:hypothetical protein